MTRYCQHWCCRLGLASWLVISGAIAFSGNNTLAQLTPDTTLGSENSTVTSTGAVDSINGGATRGTNLFHSFEEFNVGEGRSAYFNNPAGIENILSRVTGANPSNIFGTLGVSGGSANLFLINPNGIIFGANARLDVGGSFVGTTASSLNFADSSKFSATAPQSAPLLTVSIPLGLQFGEATGRIQNQSQATNSSAKVVGLQVQPGKTLALVGGNVALERGSMTAAGGRIELGSVAGTALVNLNSTEEGWALGYENTENFQDIQLSQQALVDASGEGGGNIQVRGRQITITDGSKIQAKTLGSKPGGNLAVTASEVVELIGTSADSQERSSLITDTEGNGSAGALTITAKRLLVQNGGLISTGTYPRSRGSGGNLTVTASDSVKLMGEAPDSEFQSRMTTQTQGDGSAGALTVTTGKLIVQDGGQVSAGTYPRSRGSGGNLTVTASEFVELTGVSANGEQPSRLTSHTTGAGNAKDLTITTGKLVVQGGAYVSTGVVNLSGAGSPIGQGGNLSITALDSVEVTGESANGDDFSRLTTRTEGNGAAGSLTINTGKLIVQAGGQVSAGTVSGSTGAGGNLSITAIDSVKVTGESVNGRRDYSRLTTRTEGAGDANDLTINTGKLIIEAGGQVSAGTVSGSTGAGGNLTVTASDSVEVRGGSFNGDVSSRLTTRTAGAGDAKDLTINTGKLIIEAGGQVSAGTVSGSTGAGGNLTVTASESIQVMGESVNRRRVYSRLTNRTEGEGDAQGLTINTGKLIIEAGGQVSADTELASTGSGGNLTVTASDSIEVIGRASNNFPSSLSAKSNGARSAGDLAIATEHLSIRDGAEVTVSGESTGDAGNLVISSRSTRLDNQAAIRSETVTGNGGNITLQNPDLLLMRHNSQISTSAGTAGTGGNGGNIDITDAQFIVAIPNENSDITANAFTGRGGRVQITAQGIFGLVPRSLEELKTLLGTDNPNQLNPARLPSSDITAISQIDPSLSGQVTVNTPDIDPSQGLVSLPVVPVDIQVSQACTPSGNQQQSEFVVTGRGGLPQNPGDALNTDAVQVDLVTLNPQFAQPSTPSVSTTSTSPTPTPIVEAQGWAIAANGEVILTANAPTDTPHNSWQNTANCRS
jgi:filamentous hemagglutinin family protein